MLVWYRRHHIKFWNCLLEFLKFGKSCIVIGWCQTFWVFQKNKSVINLQLVYITNWLLSMLIVKVLHNNTLFIEYISSRLICFLCWLNYFKIFCGFIIYWLVLCWFLTYRNPPLLFWLGSSNVSKLTQAEFNEPGINFNG